MSASTSEMEHRQTEQQAAVEQSVSVVQQEILQLKCSNKSLCEHLDTKADKEYLQQVMMPASHISCILCVEPVPCQCKHH